MYVCMSMCVRMCIYICHVIMYIYIRIDTSASTFVMSLCTYRFVCVYEHLRPHAHLHPHRHIHMCVCMSISHWTPIIVHVSPLFPHMHWTLIVHVSPLLPHMHVSPLLPHMHWTLIVYVSVACQTPPSPRSCRAQHFAPTRADPTLLTRRKVDDALANRGRTSNGLCAYIIITNTTNGFTKYIRIFICVCV